MPLHNPINLNIWPVLQRELRESARRWPNYWLRTLAAAAGAFVFWAAMQDTDDEPASAIGFFLFIGLHSVLMWSLCLAVPVMAADCIAREKREGTLGLLFLTPLSATGIVLGKGMVLAVRAFSLWLAVLPILTIPFVLGGITRTNLFCAASMELSAAVVSLACGLIASSVVKSRGAGFVLALSLSACFVCCPAWFVSLYFFDKWNPDDFPVYARLWVAGQLIPAFNWYVYVPGGTVATQIHVVYFILAAGIPAALLFLAFAVWLAARCIERSWQDKSPSRRHVELEKKYATPVFQRWFARHMQHVLDRNPIAWLQQYSWKARLTKWGFCLAFLLVECVVVVIDYTFLDTTETVLLVLLAGAFTFVGVNSFFTEKRNGALELLLVTPIPVNKIIIGRVVGLWKQFLPTALILATIDLADGWLEGELHWNSFIGFNYFFPPRLTIACFFLVLPFCATYFALRVKNLIVAAVLTWVALLIPPFLAGGFIFFDVEENAAAYCIMCVAANLGLILVICFLLRHSLSRRIYSF